MCLNVLLIVELNLDLLLLKKVSKKLTLGVSMAELVVPRLAVLKDCGSNPGDGECYKSFLSTFLSWDI
jgi:hypothetical protein